MVNSEYPKGDSGEGSQWFIMQLAEPEPKWLGYYPSDIFESARDLAEASGATIPESMAREIGRGAIPASEQFTQGNGEQ
jgi:hypothetical protein